MTEEIITSKKNPLLQQVRKLLSSRKARQEAGLFVSDGTKLLDEAVRYCAGLETVILTEGVQANIPPHVRTVRVSEEIMASISPMETPQGALFICKMPENTQFSPQKGMLLLDGIQDPGNLGTILRTADAFDIPACLLEGCADPFSHKVVRASMGAVFRTRVQRATWEQVRTLCAENGIPIAVTALSERAQDIRTAKLADMAVVIGSEGQGVRTEVRASTDAELIIPMNPHCESLNAAVAATVVMWQMKR